MAKRASFLDQLQNNWDKNKFVCLGLDPVIEKLPEHLKSVKGLKKFLIDLVDATADIVLCYKPNLAFYEFDPKAEEILLEVTNYIHQKYPKIPVIVDAK